jgi:hypothetical protein
MTQFAVLAVLRQSEAGIGAADISDDPQAAQWSLPWRRYFCN